MFDGRSGADIEKATVFGASPLVTASVFGHLEVVKYLMRSGADMEATDCHGASPLIIASAFGHLDVVKYLVEAEADKEKAMRGGVSPLFYASENGHLNVVEYLVESGADKDGADEYGASPLYIASCHGRLGVVKYLLACGANKETADADGAAPLAMASRHGHLDVVKYLVGEAGRCPPPSPALLPDLCSEAAADVAAWLHSVAGWGPLHFACEADCRPVIQRLLRSGASPLTEAGSVTPVMLGSAATRRFVADAVVWNPEGNTLFPPAVQDVVRTAMLLYARCGGCEGCGRCGLIATLPKEVLLLALGFLPREPPTRPCGHPPPRPLPPAKRRRLC